MQILLVSAEVAPYAKAGGLADIAASLPREWQKVGQNPIIIMPKYSFIDVEAYGFKPTHLVLNVPVGNWTEFATLWYGTLPGSSVPVYLVQNDDYFNRPGIYGYPEEFPDNDRRFIFFCRSIFEAAKAINFKPDIIHANDFHTAFTMAFLKSHYKSDPRFSRTAGVYTVHNLAFQGWFFPDRAMHFSTFGMKEFNPGCWFEHQGMVNAMKTGIMFADKITTVSPTYAKEIRYPYFSEGLQDVLNQKAGDLIGILNGVDYDEWNPEKDEYIYTRYSPKFLRGKQINKHDFLRERGVSDSDNLDLPLVGVVSRLAEQKGIDLLKYNLEYYLANNIFRFALCGSASGESDKRNYEDYFNYLAWKYPGKALIYIGYNNTVAHKIIAGADYLLIPSRFEPSGLTQMYAFKYGTIPIVRSTGGLADSVVEYNPKTARGTGFVFLHYNADDLSYAIRRALSIYSVDYHWDKIRQNAMNEDFSSRRSAMEYIKVFNWALQKVR